MEALEKYIGKHSMVPDKDAMPVLKKTRKSERDHYGNLVGEMNNNPILNTRIYELEFSYGCV